MYYSKEFSNNFFGIFGLHIQGSLIVGETQGGNPIKEFESAIF